MALGLLDGNCVRFADKPGLPISENVAMNMLAPEGREFQIPGDLPERQRQYQRDNAPGAYLDRREARTKHHTRQDVFPTLKTAFGGSG